MNNHEVTRKQHIAACLMILFLFIVLIVESVMAVKAIVKAKEACKGQDVMLVNGQWECRR